MISSAACGAVVAYYFQSIPCAVVSFLAGTLIDADHFLDYYWNRPFTLDLRQIYRIHESRALTHIYIIFHSFELLFIIWLVIWIFSLNSIFAAAAIGMTQHFILDMITNPLTALGYFFTYRIIKRFRADLILKNWRGESS